MINFALAIFTHPDHPFGAHFELWVGTAWKHYRSKVGKGCFADLGGGLVIQSESPICAS